VGVAVKVGVRVEVGVAVGGGVRVGVRLGVEVVVEVWVGVAVGGFNTRRRSPANLNHSREAASSGKLSSASQFSIAAAELPSASAESARQ
jgi:hypothetical protein